MSLSDEMKAGLEAMEQMGKPAPEEHGGRILIDVYSTNRMRIGFLPHGRIPEGVEIADAESVTRAVAVVEGMIRRLLIEGGHESKDEGDGKMSAPVKTGNQR